MLHDALKCQHNLSLKVTKILLEKGEYYEKS